MHYTETGLNGWLGRQLKKIITYAATRVDAAVNYYSGGLIKTDFGIKANSIGMGSEDNPMSNSWWNRQIIKENCDLEFDNDSRGDYDLTIEETSVLERFSDSFSNIVAMVVLQFNDFSKTENDLSTKINLANAILERIAIVKAYYKENELQLLSFQAVQSRDLIIDYFFAPHICAIKDFVSLNSDLILSDLQINIKAGSVLRELEPSIVNLSQNLTVNTLKIQLKLKKDFQDWVDLHPVGVEDINLGANQIIDPKSQPVATKKKSSINWLLLAIAGFAGYKILK